MAAWDHGDSDAATAQDGDLPPTIAGALDRASSGLSDARRRLPDLAVRVPWMALHYAVLVGETVRRECGASHGRRSGAPPPTD